MLFKGGQSREGREWSPCNLMPVLHNAKGKLWIVRTSCFLCYKACMMYGCICWQTVSSMHTRLAWKKCMTRAQETRRRRRRDAPPLCLTRSLPANLAPTTLPQVSIMFTFHLTQIAAVARQHYDITSIIMLSHSFSVTCNWHRYHQEATCKAEKLVKMPLNCNRVPCVCWHVHHNFDRLSPWLLSYFNLLMLHLDTSWCVFFGLYKTFSPV